MRRVWARTTLLLVAMGLLGGCDLSRGRLKKALLSPEYVVEVPPAPPEALPPLAAVSYAVGDVDEAVHHYRPPQVFYDDRAFQRTPNVSRSGWILVEPAAPDVVMSLWLRNIGSQPREFYPLRSVTGELRGEVPNELRFIPNPAPLSGPLRLPISNLRTVYNDFDMEDGDLLMVELHQPSTGRVERYVFQYRAFGLRTNMSYAVLFRVPVPGVQAANTIDVGGLSFVASLGLGYRFPSERLGRKWISDQLTGVLVVGVGSTAVANPGGLIEDQIRGAFSSGIVGAGLQAFDFVSLNVLLNPSVFFDNPSQDVWALAVGFDAVQFTLFTRSLWDRLFEDNRLEDMDGE